MSRSFSVPFALGWIRRRGKRQAIGGMLKARNSRFLPGDARRIWALLGRAKYNSTAMPNGSFGEDDAAIPKALFPVYYDGAGGKLISHKGGTLFAGTLAATGTFVEEQVMAQLVTDAVPRGIPAAYRGELASTHWYYPTGRTGWNSLYHFWARSSSGWVLAGHRTPTATFTVAGNGSGSFGSANDIKFTCRIYDDVTDTESAHGPVVTLTAPGATFTDFRLTFASGLALLATERGTHVRIYATLLDEEPGIYYRCDPQMTGYVTDKGIAIADFTNGFTIDDDATNTQRQINGTVRADGQEGTVSWAEHGGEPPQCGGVTVFQDHMVYYDVNGRPNDLLYSPTGYPESVPVDFDGEYAYYVRLQSDKDDRCLRCLKAGDYLIAFCENSIFRLTHLPTFEDPGFSRNIQQLVTDSHGIAGRFAAASFGVGADQAQQIIYVSREHGIMITDGLSTSAVVQAQDFLGLVEPTKMDLIECRDYTKYQEIWIHYTPVGGSSNTQAVIVSYSQLRSGFGLRVTGPVDVTATMSAYALGTDSVQRMYLGDPSEKIVYVQDEGNKDEQQNVNAAGHIKLDWHTARYSPFRQRGMIQVHRGIIYGVAGAEFEFTVTHYSLDGQKEYSTIDKVKIGGAPPDTETSDVFMIESMGQMFREELTYTGLSGSTYDESAATCAPAIEAIDYEYQDAGPVGQTRQPS